MSSPKLLLLLVVATSNSAPQINGRQVVGQLLAGRGSLLSSSLGGSSQQCSTVNEQQCNTVNNAQCNTVNEQQCNTVNEQQCRTVSNQQCTTVNEQVRRLVYPLISNHVPL